MYGNYYGMNNYGGYQTPYSPAVPDGLAQLRAGQGLQTPTMPGMIWVLGEAEARSYPVSPNTTVVLWDRDTPTIFIKSANPAGMPSLDILEWKRRSPEPQEAAQSQPTIDTNRYVTREEFEALKQKIGAQEVENNG